jgi:ribose/xylose/arabinose/galactoside ABC-type transport system permease subunit
MTTPRAPAADRMLDLALDHGFQIILVLLVLGFTWAAPGFLRAENIFGILHSMVPITIIAAGMALIVMLGKLDISLGSTAFASASVAALAMQPGGPALPPALAFAAALCVGAVLGAVNGFVVCILRVNPLIATLGTMIAFRGMALQMTDSQVIVLPDAVRGFGNWTLGPLFFDTVIAAVLLIAIHLLHRETPFGRTVTAIGNDEATAARIGLPTRRTVFLCFVLSGVLAAIGGFLGAAQTGSVTTFLGRGVEFVAVAVVVVGGISLFGGRGSILTGVLLGALTFEVIRSGLNYVGANPYSYQLIGGAVIFVAMYASSLKERRGGSLR